MDHTQPRTACTSLKAPFLQRIGSGRCVFATTGLLRRTTRSALSHGLRAPLRMVTFESFISVFAPFQNLAAIS